MICPKCGAKQTGDDAVGKKTVFQSRHNSPTSIRRRRHCWSCGFRWSTLEVIGTPDDGLRELEGQKFLSI